MRDRHSRRDFLARYGIGTAALAHLMAVDGMAGAQPVDPLLPKKPPLPAKAKNVIFMFMEGAPSQVDLFDPKPGLQKWHGSALPESMTKNLRLAFIKPTAKVMASPRVFKPAGQCGMELSDFIPDLATCADDICLVRSMYTDAFNHHPAQLMMMSGVNL